MSTFVFCGPSTYQLDVRAWLPDAVLRPPAKSGDTHLALRQGATRIVLIDGYFRQVASIRHKEILYALSRGVWVFGGASMGALRAAELAPFGVIGVGEIFQAFNACELEDDDEVALIHGDADSEYRELSTAMVDIRFALRTALHARLIDVEFHDQLVRAAKQRFYAQRSWNQLFADAAAFQRVERDALRRLRDWVNSTKPSQKRADAQALLAEVRAHEAAEAGPLNPTFRFEPTLHWQRMWDDASCGSAKDCEG